VCEIAFKYKMVGKKKTMIISTERVLDYSKARKTSSASTCFSSSIRFDVYTHPKISLCVSEIDIYFCLQRRHFHRIIKKNNITNSYSGGMCTGNWATIIFLAILIFCLVKTNRVWYSQIHILNISEHNIVFSNFLTINLLIWNTY